jgi:hypothetical protein
LGDPRAATTAFGFSAKFSVEDGIPDYMKTVGASKPAAGPETTRTHKPKVKA